MPTPELEVSPERRGAPRSGHRAGDADIRRLQSRRRRGTCTCSASCEARSFSSRICHVGSPFPGVSTSSRFRATKDASATSGAVRLVLDVRAPLRGKHVLVVEDIVDSGQDSRIFAKNPRGARAGITQDVCAATENPTASKYRFRSDYLGFTIPDKWVVGYGLDYTDRYRTLPYIGVVQPDP